MPFTPVSQTEKKYGRGTLFQMKPEGNTTKDLVEFVKM